MVDRITPKVTEFGVKALQETHGLVDRAPVYTEPFRQWVVEAGFCNGRPPLEDVGVDVVSDVAPYKLVKTRLLNGSHCALSHLGILFGKRTTDAVMSDSDLRCFVEHLVRRELSPLVAGVANVDLDEYCRTLLTRLANVHVADDLSRLAARGSTKMPSYLLPSLRQARAERRPTALLTLAVAAWFRCLRGYDMHGRIIDVADHRAKQLTMLARAGMSDPRPLLSVRDVFGDLGDDTEFVGALETMLRDIDRLGVGPVLRRTIGLRHRDPRQEGSDVASHSSL